MLFKWADLLHLCCLILSDLWYGTEACRQNYFFKSLRNLSWKWDLFSAMQTNSVGGLPWPGFEPGLLRPQRRVLTTIRSRPVVGCCRVWLWCDPKHLRIPRIAYVALRHVAGSHVFFCVWSKIIDSRDKEEDELSLRCGVSHMCCKTTHCEVSLGRKWAGIPRE